MPLASPGTRFVSHDPKTTYRPSALICDSNDELFAELDRRNTVVYIHPSDPPDQGIPLSIQFPIDTALETVRAAISQPIRAPAPSVETAMGGDRVGSKWFLAALIMVEIVLNVAAFMILTGWHW